MRRKTESPLRTLRRARTISQADLAKLVGVTQETISKAERGIIRLQPTLRARIAAILGAAEPELFGKEQKEAVAS